MKATLAAAVLLVAAATASAAIDAYMTFVTLPQAVKLGDGSVLPAGKYDVKVDYKGFGGSAEFLFLQGGVLKGRTPAEARGFPQQAPGGAPDVITVKPEKFAPAVKYEDAKGQVKGENLDPIQKGVPAGGAPHEFAWGPQGFPPGIVGKTTPAGKSLKISVDSANSAAGFSALLPAIQKGAK
jgi:opacity protein-like surface antigen